MSARSEGRVGNGARPGGIPEEILSVVREIVERESGIVLGLGNKAQVWEALRERMRALRISDPYEYILLIMEDRRGKEERERLVVSLTVGETGFFRTVDHFLALRDRILPGLAEGGARFPIRIWSAGCATGEEPYSIAIAALEAFQGRVDQPVRVLGTDIHPEYLATARRGEYALPPLKAFPSARHAEYFRPVGETRVRVSEEVRQLVSFEEANLVRLSAAPGPFGSFSVIFCRNVMIYFRPDMTRRIVAKFRESLEEGGVLFLGHSETMWGISDDFTLERHGGGYYYRNTVGRKVGRASAESVPAKVPDNGVPPRGVNPALELAFEAEVLADRNRLEEAERLCRKAMELDPSCAEASYLLAVLLRRENYLEDALLCAERSVSADPAFVMAVIEGAECLSLLGRRGEALTRWREAYRLVEKGGARLPRFSSTAGASVKTLREYIRSHLFR